MAGYKMLIPKDQWERQIFSEFAEAARIVVDLGSVVSGKPPQPDILITVGARPHCAELVEITDQGLAKNHMTSLKTGAITGGAFSQKQPLEHAFLRKASKTYEADGAPLDLVAYYDKQLPAVSVEPDLIPDTVEHIVHGMVESGASCLGVQHVQHLGEADPLDVSPRPSRHVSIRTCGSV